MSWTNLISIYSQLGFLQKNLVLICLLKQQSRFSLHYTHTYWRLQSTYYIKTAQMVGSLGHCARGTYRLKGHLRTMWNKQTSSLLEPLK